MRNVFRSVLIASTIFIASVSPSKAKVIVWQDPGSDASITVPDSWKRIHNQKPDDVVRFALPGEASAHASCRFRVREDARFRVYPPRFSDAVQRTYVSRNFWEEYLAEKKGYSIIKVSDDASLGRGFASYAEALFIGEETPPAQVVDGVSLSSTQNIRKRTVMLASIYNDKMYIFECSAEQSAYDEYHKAFVRAANSINFRKAAYEIPSGYYRNFLKRSEFWAVGAPVRDASYR